MYYQRYRRTTAGGCNDDPDDTTNSNEAIKRHRRQLRPRLTGMAGRGLTRPWAAEIPAESTSAASVPGEVGRVLPRLRPRELLRICVTAVTAWFDHNASSLGAALAYYTLFSIAPILIITVAIAGYVFGANSAQTQVLSQLQALIGDAGAAAVKDLVLNAHYSDKKGLAAAVGLITLVIGASSVFGELQNALERVWQTPKPEREVGWWRLLRTRVLSVGMVLGVGFLLLVSLVASAALAAFGGWLGTFLPQLEIVLPLLDLVLSFGLSVLLFAMIYKYVPRESIPWGDVWIGACATALLFTIGKVLIGIYLGKSSFNSAYGAAGSLIVLLLWIYYSAQIFLLGAEFTRAFAYARGSRRNYPEA